jgi:hypothetical protein
MSSNNARERTSDVECGFRQIELHEEVLQVGKRTALPAPGARA